MAFGVCPEAAGEVTASVRKKTKKPLFIKLSPNVTDIAQIAQACEAAGADGISMINTLLGMRIDLKTKKPVIANKMGGFSGHAILPVALRMVYQDVYKRQDYMSLSLRAPYHAYTTFDKFLLPFSPL